MGIEGALVKRAEREGAAAAGNKNQGREGE